MESLPYHAWRAEGDNKYVDIDHELYIISLQESFRDQGLQVDVQIGGIELDPTNPSLPGEDWHVEGTRSEHIVATATYYHSISNITPMHLSFRQKTRMSGSAYHMDDDDLPHSVPGAQEMGKVESRKGRLLSWSSVLHYRTKSFTLEDPAQKGHVRFLKIMLVDARYRVCSTLNTRPQRHDWWADEISQRENLSAKLAQELLDGVLKEVRNGR